MATMKRRYNPDVPIDITSDEVNGEVLAEAKDETKNVKVKVVKWSNSESEREEGVIFKIEIGIPFRWLMIGYCQKLGLDYQTTRFELNGAKLREMDTPHQLGMLHDDVIFAFPNRGSSGFEAVPYVTLIIRLHKEQDTILRVKCSTAILPQLMQCFPNSGSQEQGSLCFVYRELKLTQNHTANELKMEDGDIIDCFNFKTMGSSLSIIPSHLTLKVKCITGRVTQFRVTQNTRLSKIFDKLSPEVPESNQSVRNNLQLFCVRLGRQISETNTVEEQQLKDGDEIRTRLCLKGC